MIDAGVVALAHRRALGLGEPGQRYALVGLYLSYADLASEIAQLTGRPRWVVHLPDSWEWPLVRAAGLLDRLGGGRWIEVSAAVIAGAFLRLHVKGDRDDSAFGLIHLPPRESIHEALADARCSGLTPGLRLRHSESRETTCHTTDYVVR